jgi:hypothetical protein
MKNLLALLIVILLLPSCKDKSTGLLLDPSKDQELLSKYFSAATQGTISAADELVFVLSKPLQSTFTQEEIAKLIVLSPEVSGKISISNNTIIKFVPDDALYPDKEYRVNINLKTVFPSEFDKDISYMVKTFKQEIKVEKEGVIINADNSISILINVLSADKIKLIDLKDCFSSDADEILVSET